MVKHAYLEVITNWMLLFFIENLKLLQVLGYPDKVQMLLNAGANKNVFYTERQTPLHKGNKMNYLLIYLYNNDFLKKWKAISKNSETAIMLIEKGADLNAQDINGETPIFYGS